MELSRVFVKICSNKDLFPSKRDQNGSYATISCHTVASGVDVGGGLPLGRSGEPPRENFKV